MSYEVLARKWRPQQFDDIVGQDHVSRTLKNAIESERIAHAYLFVGPRGIGKTSIARIFSKALNCEKGPTVKPCDKCDSCREIIAGTNLDVLEIDGASNNGVEQVRDLRETVKYAPTRGPYKIYIIDEVHMLSVAAFNALLKTLEEPPSHVKFLFATTEPEKILATILSRCQRFNLRRIPVGEIVTCLSRIAKAEKVSVDEDALLAIARASEGALRDAESALDQLVSFKGTEISEQDVLSVFGLVSRSTLEGLAEKILGGDIKAVIQIVFELDEAGKDLQRLVLELMDHYRNLLVCMHVDGAANALDITETQYKVLKTQINLTNAARVQRITDILSETEGRMRYALSRRTLLETALIRCARAAVVVSLEEILHKINELKKNVRGREKEPAETSSNIELPTSNIRRRQGYGGQVEHRSKETEPVSTADAAPAVIESVKERNEAAGGLEQAIGDEEEMLRERWHEIVEKVGKIAIHARSSLMDAGIASLEDDRVLISVDPEFESEAERLKSSRNRKAIEHVLSAMLKRDVTAEFTVGKGSERAGRESASGKKGKQEKGKDAGNDNKESKEQKSGRDWTVDSTVQKVMDVFGGTITDVRE